MRNIIFRGFRLGALLIGINIIYKTAIYSLRLKENIIKIKCIEEKEKREKITKENVIYKNYILRYTSIAKFNYVIEESVQGYCMQLYANTALSAAMYNVQLWLCSLQNKFLKRCRVCFKHFATSDNKEKYCKTPCNLEMYKKRKTRGKNVKILKLKNNTKVSLKLI